MKLTEKYIETSREFYVRLFQIAVPVILQSIITTGVNLVDNIMLGQLTETALGASTQANQFVTLFTFATMGISMGSSVLSSRFYGAKDNLSLKKSITLALRFSVILACIFTFLSIFFPRQIISLYFQGRETEIIAAGVTYLRWSIPSFLLMAVSFVCTNSMRSAGLTHVPLIASACAFGINIGANYIFIFGHCGAPEMGVAGAALGTVIARVVEVSIILIFFFRDKTIHYRPEDFFLPCGDLLPEFTRICIPVMLSDTLLGLGDNVLAIVMGQIGTNFVTANSITNVIQRVSTIFITGLAFSSCFLTGQVLGERRVEDAQRQGYTYAILGLVIGILASVIILFIAAPVINAYNISAETREIAFELMDAVSIIIIFRSTNSILTKGVLRGGGDTKFLLVADMSTMWLLAVPLGALAGLVLKLPAFWVYLFLHCDQIVKAVWCVFRLKSEKWIKKVKGVKL